MGAGEPPMGEVIARCTAAAADPRSVVVAESDLGADERDLMAMIAAPPELDATDRAVIVAALAPRWLARGQLPGRNDIVGSVIDALDPAVDAPWLIAVLHGWSALAAAERAVAGADIDDVVTRSDHALRLAADCDDRTRLLILGLCTRARRILPASDLDDARCTEGAQLAHALGEPIVEVQFQIWSAMFALRSGEIDRAGRVGAAAFQRARALGVTQLMISAVGMLVSVPSAALGDVALPAPIELAEMARASGERRTEMWLLATAVAQAVRLGDHPWAAREAAAMIRSASDARFSPASGPPTMALVLIAGSTGSHVVAARLHGSISGSLEALRPTTPTSGMHSYDNTIAQARAVLGDAAFDAAATAGSMLTFEQATSEALAFARTVERGGRRRQTNLTAREEQVLELMARGQRNKEIGSDLGITTKTVMHHTSSIYRKLAVSGRSAAVAAWVGRPAPSAPNSSGTTTATAPTDPAPATT